MKRPLLAILLCAALLATTASAGDVAVGSRTFWDTTALNRAPRTFPVTQPCSNEYGRIAGVEPIWIEGEPWRGKPTRVFAWWGLPKGASAARRVPAMVLVHGGGGTAFAKWVKVWNDRGYAAIAMDTCAKIPGERDGRPHARHAWSGPNGWAESVRQIDEPIRDQWTYHAVAAVMRSHSFLRSRPEIIADRIGLTGISWGGYLTSIVMCVDGRFRFAAPVYGCGWYDLNPVWERHFACDHAAYAKWIALWDPKNFLREENGGAQCPVLWCCGSNDLWYPLDAVKLSCDSIRPPIPLALSLKLRMPHAHGSAGDPKEIAALANHYLKGGAPLVEVTSTMLRDGQLHVRYDAHGRKVVKAELLATADTNPILEKRPWTATPIAAFSPDKDSFSLPVPPETVMCFVNLVTDDGLVASSRLFWNR